MSVRRLRRDPSFLGMTLRSAMALSSGADRDASVQRVSGPDRTRGRHSARLFHRRPAADLRAERGAGDAGRLPARLRSGRHRIARLGDRASRRSRATHRVARQRQPARAGRADRHRARPGHRPRHPAPLRRRARRWARRLVLCQHPRQPGAGRGHGAGRGRPAAGALARGAAAGGHPGAAERLPSLRAERRSADAAHRRSSRAGAGDMAGRVDRRCGRGGGRL